MNASVIPFRGSLLCRLACAVALLLTGTLTTAQVSVREKLLQCQQDSGILCTEQLESPAWTYIGHDEPSLLFYSNKAGSGYTNVYR